MLDMLRSRNLHLWLGSYLRQKLRQALRRRPSGGRVFFCVADHYEPYWNGADVRAARARTRRWKELFPRIAGAHVDSAGKPPQHTFFYPAEEYDPVILDWLEGIRQKGLGDVEIHLHHDRDTAEGLERKLEEFKVRLHDGHGLLRRDGDSERLRYAFIHGNLALDNSRPDGRWCGVDNELEVLSRTGCYADMTLPSAPGETQTAKINSIYFARGRPGRSKSHDCGRDVAVGDWGRDGELLMIQGPLALNWTNREMGLLPRIDAGELSEDCPPTAQRVRLWGRCGISVRGAEDNIFIKVHTHGAQERNLEMLLEGGGYETLWEELERQYRDVAGWELHYVTAWQLYRRVRELALRLEPSTVIPAGANGGSS